MLSAFDLNDSLNRSSWCVSLHINLYRYFHSNYSLEHLYFVAALVCAWAVADSPTDKAPPCQPQVLGHILSMQEKQWDR